MAITDDFNKKNITSGIQKCYRKSYLAVVTSDCEYRALNQLVNRSVYFLPPSFFGAFHAMSSGFLLLPYQIADWPLVFLYPFAFASRRFSIYASLSSLCPCRSKGLVYHVCFVIRFSQKPVLFLLGRCVTIGLPVRDARKWGGATT